jgi:hypothetical protein
MLKWEIVAGRANLAKPNVPLLKTEWVRALAR